MYESLYDALPDYEDKHHKHQDSSLVKIAEVAGRSIKKLRRNWSIKKDDLSKGLSKIKRSSKTLIEDVYTKEGINLMFRITRNPLLIFNIRCQVLMMSNIFQCFSEVQFRWPAEDQFDTVALHR